MTSGDDPAEHLIATAATGVILAGGGSRRMGSEKARLMIAGEPLLRRTIRRLRGALAEVVVVGPAALADLAEGALLLPDEQPGLGPLGGLATALHALVAERIFVVACDMPFVAPALVGAQVRLALARPAADAVVLRSTHGTEYLHAVYARSALPLIEAQLRADERSLRQLHSRLTVAALTSAEAARYDVTGRSAFNANTPEDWAHALELAGT